MSNNIHEEGYAITEVLFSIAVISAIFILISGITYTTGIISNRSKKAIQSNVDQLLIDDLLRKEFNAIAIPYWEHTITISIDTHALELPFYHGERNDSLKIYSKDGCYFLETPGRAAIELGANFTITSFQIMTNKDGQPVGVDLYYQYQEKNEHLTAAFSTSPIIKKVSP